MRRDGIGSITAIDGRGCPAFKMRSSIFKPVLIDHLIPVNRWNLSLLKPAPPIKANKLKLVQAWVEIHSEDLMADWELAVKGEQVFKIEPLR